MTRADLHKLVDALPDSAVEVATRLLERAAADLDLADLLAAPWDDEPVTEEEMTAHRAGLEAIERGEGVEWDEAKRRLG
ncbi:MAG: hypothetical protein J2P44_03605 [Candidatus Dormibacteraeota bacterium]|nr:hypothetical protein [Candidatus Dormibacteraeota bacterium]